MMNSVYKYIQYARRHGENEEKLRSFFDSIRKSSNIIEDLMRVHPKILKQAREVRNHVNRLKGLIRFQPYKDLLFASYSSTHCVSDLIGLHFKKRYPNYHVIAFNKDRREASVTMASRAEIPVEMRSLFEKYLLPKDNKDYCISIDFLLRFRNDREFYDNFLQQLFQKIYPLDDLENLNKDNMNFQQYWNTFYDSQILEGRINPKRALHMLPKNEVIRQLGKDSIEFSRIIKQVSKHQKTLFDF